MFRTSKGTSPAEKLATFPCEIVIETGQGYVPPSVPFQITVPHAAVRSPTRMRGNEYRWENHSKQGSFD